MKVNPVDSSKSSFILAESIEVITVDKPVTKLAIPPFILGMKLKEIEPQAVFTQVDDNLLSLDNPQFVHVFSLVKGVDSPSCSEMTVLDKWESDSYGFWSAVPTNSMGKTQSAWEQENPNFLDWRSGGTFVLVFPFGGVYWTTTRGADLTVQSHVIDTRWREPSVPTNLTAQDLGNQLVKLNWKDSSSDETAFHILIEQYIGDKWVKIPSYQRAVANATTLNWQAPSPGYYRFQIRSAYSKPEQSWSFKRPVGIDKYENVTFVTPSVVKYSQLSGFTYLLVNGTFSNPAAPTNFGGAKKTDNSIFFVWQDNSNNESVFHILEEKWINNEWVRQPLIRVFPNRSSFTLSPRQPGKYRYAVRSAYSFPDTSISRTSSITPWIEFVI